MAISSQAVANEFIRLANGQGKQLTNMQLQKLVFIANGYHLAIYNAPLYYHDSYAWQFGPVIPKLYKALQKYGANVVTESIEADDSVKPDSDQALLIDGVYEFYGNYTGGQLSNLTHQPNTPWSKTWKENKFGVIGSDIIRDHYKDLLQIKA